MRARRFRPFRLGLWLGALAALVWFVRRQRGGPDEVVTAGAGGWGAVDRPAPTAPPSTPTEPAVPTAPVVPMVRPEIVEVGDVELPGEPEVGTVDIPDPEPAPEPEPEPVVDAVPQPEPEAAPAPVVEPVAKKVPPVKKAAKKKAVAKRKAPIRKAAAWVTPEPGGICPSSHPVKAKLLSGLFHVPGMFAYDRTKPDRCYLDDAAAEADGLRKAKR